MFYIIIAYSQNQLEDLFSRFGRIISSKVLPFNPSFEGGCGYVFIIMLILTDEKNFSFVNFADTESSNQAVAEMNNTVVDGFTINVSHSGVNEYGKTNN